MTQDGKPIEYSSLKKSHKRRLEQKSEHAAEEKSPFDRWDPRFDDSCGKLDKKQFHQAYAFVDQLKRDEKQQVKKQLDEIDADIAHLREKSTDDFDYDAILIDRKKALRKKLRSYLPSWKKKQDKQRRRFGRPKGPSASV
ncbi:hypothetical protein XU18_4679 [Perkinsela sp. CCAP 1560/4]|nr:hypothetical protein XU18_4679 [Perkinsela sp. CCAP 1560/4]|eukprot:KNH04009.1 hypothetical protein XU18_4679 [Perkinsela sp. CCAP 1560/4]